MSKISVVVPIYNIDSYLKCCIESILKQTFTDFELLLVDDGSTDLSCSICKSFLYDSRVKYFKKLNGGLSSARNFGIDKASGAYICFIDGDDAISPNYLERLYSFATNNNADITICNYLNFKGEIPKSLNNFKTSCRKIDFCNYWDNTFRDAAGIVVWNKLFKIELFKTIKFLEGKFHEDEFIIHHLVYSAKNIIYIDDSLYFYRQRNGSIMSTESFEKIIDSFDALFDRYVFFDSIHYACASTDNVFWRSFNFLVKLYRFKTKTKININSRKKAKTKFLIMRNIYKKNHKIKFNLRVLSFSPKLYIFLTHFYKF